MKKGIIAAVAVVSAGLLAFTGCSKKAKKSEKITLTVWESLLGPDEFIKQAGAKYTESHPNVEIKFVNVELGDSTGQIALDGPAGVGADLFAAPHDKLGELVNGGHVAPTANADVVAKEVLGACSKALTYEGKMYGYPVSAETYALFYNKDLIAEKDVPKTWDDLAKWAIEFNKKNPDKRGFVMDVGNAYYSIVFTTENGNRIFGSTGADTSTTYLNNDDAVNGMKFFQSLRNALDVPAADLSTGVCDAAFQGGQAAMHITGPWNVKNFVDAKLNFGVAPLPSLPGDTVPAASFSGTRAMFVSSYSDHPEEAADFAQFLISPAMQQLRFDITGAMPAINVKVSSEYIGGFLNQLDYAFPMPSVPQMSAFWDALGNASKNIWNGADVKKELDACNATILGM
ncbi:MULTISPECIES: maltose ABC transporter substrate-binding protein [unclassified Treponema]|uniref:sugar ABC transporter substrate-binding protein n=1 Tax=unclassified Treponema TaxID=2638727 RepID=UPI000E8FFD3A|nr:MULTISPECIES: maltose ABC transporter substrate-binding protein [unclassified Treponema]HAZ95756.1 maltose ABC transporter substrate-binding protein [Treponema sp.]HBP09973.1 maltose ABC transporter substrate-binding protein [Treponema sp.]